MNVDHTLVHWGIKDMKWHVRRYQNPDGTYTEEGKARRRSGYSSETPEARLARRKQYVADRSIDNKYYDIKANGYKKGAKIAQESQKIVGEFGKFVDIHADNKRANTVIDLSSMTDQELQRAVNRMNLERQYSSLTYSDKGSDYVRTALKVAGGAAAIANSALTIAVAMKTLRR